VSSFVNVLRVQEIHLIDVYFFYNFQHNTVTIKVENDMNAVTEDDPISINTDGMCIHSGFSMAKAEPEVRLFPIGLCMVVDVFF
jgi:hypothetical protein